MIEQADGNLSRAMSNHHHDVVADGEGADQGVGSGIPDDAPVLRYRCGERSEVLRSDLLRLVKEESVAETETLQSRGVLDDRDTRKNVVPLRYPKARPEHVGHERC